MGYVSFREGNTAVLLNLGKKNMDFPLARHLRNGSKRIGLRTMVLQGVLHVRYVLEGWKPRLVELVGT